MKWCQVCEDLVGWLPAGRADTSMLSAFPRAKQGYSLKEGALPVCPLLFMGEAHETKSTQHWGGARNAPQGRQGAAMARCSYYAC